MGRKSCSGDATCTGFSWQPNGECANHYEPGLRSTGAHVGNIACYVKDFQEEVNSMPMRSRAGPTYVNGANGNNPQGGWPSQSNGYQGNQYNNQNGNQYGNSNYGNLATGAAAGLAAGVLGNQNRGSQNY